MVTVNINPKSSGPRWAPQIVLLLDDQSRVLNVNRSLAGTSFSSISAPNQECLHQQLHPNCDGECRFNKMWAKAWAGLTTRESIEWEVNDAQLSRLLRLNLSKPPAPKNLECDRRQHLLLTITDITKYRREHESLIERQQALIKLLHARSAGSDDSNDQEFDELGDTGNRLMAGYIKKEHSFGHQLVLAQENERKRIASELHDGIVQTIGVAKYKIEASVAFLAEQNPDLDVSVFDDAVDEIKGAIDEIRRISSNLAPSMLEDFGVCVALEWLCKEFTGHNREVRASCTTCIDEGETPDLVKIAIYRVVQEALNNAANHSSATRVDVSLNTTDERVTLMISDNGTGFDLQAQQRDYGGKSGLGLRSMRERVEATGGMFDIESAPGKSVVIRAEWAEADLDLTRQ